MSSKRAMKQAQKQAYARHRSNITNSRFGKMKRNLSKVNDQETLNKKIEKLEKRNKKLRGYQGFVNKLGYKELDGLDPDEIKLKLDQIMDWNDNEKNNTNN